MTHDPSHESAEPHPLLASILERNIRTVIAQKERLAGRRSLQDKLADAITDFSGHMGFVYLHFVWFAGWIGWNLGAFGARPFDPYPFGLLTMIVSLEAIFLATFVLISQNRISDEADHRANLDLQIGLLTEHEITRGLKMLDQIHHHLGLKEEAGTDLKELEAEVHPEDVLKEIETAEHRIRARR
ncbi:MAG TPA: DUF1003 domain-containing protein [Thermoanaerobaculia bacterium]|jgi:uncharacterized membrane protein